MANDIDHAFDVHVDDLRKLLGRDLPERGVLIDNRRVVQQQIRRRAGCQQSPGPCPHLFVRGHVHDIELVRTPESAAQFLDGFR